MKMNTDQRNKLIAAVFGAICVIVIAQQLFFNGSSSSAPQPQQAQPAKQASKPQATTAAPASTAPPKGANAGMGTAPGVDAQKLASASSSLDPTLDERAMLRTESLVYSGNGRNIFSLASAPPPVVIPKNVPIVRPVPVPPAPPVPTGPPPPPPINLKFFGTFIRQGGLRRAFLLQGDDVYLASEGEVVARKYKIVTINATTVVVTDLANNNTQTLPLQQN